MSSNAMPVVLIIFNRPKLTAIALERLSVVKPYRIYVIADGPRTTHPQDAEKCQATRALIETISWDCHVSKNYSDTNLGCQKRIYTGLNWVFDQVESAIILEDDCLPELSFFNFCSELLTKYKDDSRIVTISGNNFQFNRKRTDSSYYFSIYPHCWGWATWKRAWQNCDIEMANWPLARRQNLLNNVLSSSAAVRYWTYKFEQVYSGEIKSWAYPWTLSCWSQNGLSIIPKDNLVSNIGFEPDGTHHKNSNDPFSGIPTIPMSFPLVHPKFIVRNKQADEFTQSYQFGLAARVWRKVLSLIVK